MVLPVLLTIHLKINLKDQFRAVTPFLLQLKENQISGATSKSIKKVDPFCTQTFLRLIDANMSSVCKVKAMTLSMSQSTPVLDNKMYFISGFNGKYDITTLYYATRWLLLELK